MLIIPTRLQHSASQPKLVLHPHLLHPVNDKLIGMLTNLPAQRADLPAITQLIYQIGAAEGDASIAVTPKELENEWEYEALIPKKTLS